MVEFHVLIYIYMYLGTSITDVHSILVLFGIDKSKETTEHSLLSHPTTAAYKFIHELWPGGRPCVFLHFFNF